MVGLLGLVFAGTAWGQADLSVEQRADPELALVDNTVVYALKVSNNGPDAATEVLLIEAFSPGGEFIRATPSQGSCSPGEPLVCTLGTLAAGASATVAVEIIPRSATTISADAAVSSSLADPDPTGNTASIAVSAVHSSESADLAISLRDRPDPVAEGNRVVYTAVVRNQGPAAATAVTLFERIRPLNLSAFDRANTTAGSCTTFFDTCTGSECVSASTRPLEVNCNLGTLLPAATATIEVAVFADVSWDTNLNASASVTSTVADPDTANNSASESTNVVDHDFFAVRDGLTCLITSSAVGTPLVRHLDTFRRFRDRYLLSHFTGRALVRLYERYSPPAAHYVHEHAHAMALVRILLWIALGIIAYPAQSALSLLIVHVAFRRLKTKTAPA